MARACMCVCVCVCACVCCQVSGLALLGLGIWMKVELHIYMQLTSVYYDAVPYVVVAVGGLVVVVASLGCLCTIKGFPALLYLVSYMHLHAPCSRRIRRLDATKR